MKIEKNEAARRQRKPLTLYERQYILQMKARGMGVREIGRKLSRNHSVISRMLKSLPYSPYLDSLTPLEKAIEMERRAKLKRSEPRKKLRLKCHETRVYVEDKLKLGWSPELIAGRLSIEHPHLSTNYESIYQWIHFERRDLEKYLPVAGKKKRRRGSGRKHRVKQPAAPKQSIETRPEVINERLRFGDWEADTLVSKQSTDSLLNLVERLSRYIILEKIADCSAESGSSAMIEMLGNVPPKLRRSVTLDNGPENSGHQKVDKALRITSYFCHPYCASERGTLENRNGFIRRYLPKKTDFSTVSHEEVKRIQDTHNHRPMKCLDFLTPHEVFYAVFKESCHA